MYNKTPIGTTICEASGLKSTNRAGRVSATPKRACEALNPLSHCRDVKRSVNT